MSEKCDRFSDTSGTRMIYFVHPRRVRHGCSKFRPMLLDPQHPDLSIQSRILARIRRGGRGRVFVSKDFLTAGSREAVDQALSRLSREDTIRRLGRGLYYYPRVNPRLG